MSVLVERTKWKKYMHSINERAYKLNSITLKICSIKCLKEFTKKRVNESEILNRIQQRVHKRLIACSLKYWIKKSLNVIKKRKQSELSIKLSRQKYLRVYFNTWHSLFLHKSIIERQEQTTQLFYRKKMISRTLVGWKEWFSEHNWKERYSFIIT
jgi:hypothetical protein